MGSFVQYLDDLLDQARADGPEPNDYEIVVIGPAAPRFLLSMDDINGEFLFKSSGVVAPAEEREPLPSAFEEMLAKVRNIAIDAPMFVASAHARLYLIPELERVAPMFRGLPVFYQHGGTGKINTRLLIGDKARVGRITKSWWVPERHEIHANLHVTSEYWQRLFRHWPDRHQWGFSMTTKILTVEDESSGLEIVALITSITSVDLVERPAAGGRFNDAPMPDNDRLTDLDIHLDRVKEEKRMEKEQ